MSDQEMPDLPETLPEPPVDKTPVNGGWTAPEMPPEPSVSWSAPEAVRFDSPHPKSLSANGEELLAQVDFDPASSPMTVMDQPSYVDSQAPAESDSSAPLRPLHAPETQPEKGQGGEVNEAAEDDDATQEFPVRLIDSRIDALTRKIEQYPDSPVNHVLRGELYLADGDEALAAADFEKAIELAEGRADALDWGYINAATIDRAIAGLRQMNRYR